MIWHHIISLNNYSFESLTEAQVMALLAVFFFCHVFCLVQSPHY